MNAEDLVLNIAVNLGRLSKWSMEGKEARINQFLKETQNYLDELEVAPKKAEFLKTFKTFKSKFQDLKTNIYLNEIWAEEMLTWSNILTHRARLA